MARPVHACQTMLGEEPDAHEEAGRRAPMSMMARGMYAPYRWVQVPIACLAVWLITSPLSLGYQSAALAWSDAASGVASLLLVGLALSPRRGWASWMQAVIGLWLLTAPLVFWAPTPVAYANDTLVGSLLIAFGLLVPMGMQMRGAQVPPGWSYNPSSWPQRAPMVALAVVGFFVSRHLAAYQLGYIDGVWDPFFGDGTERVLDSEVSRAFPISDAGLGAVTYGLEILMALMGDQRRWRTMPWMVAAFGVVVVPLGVVSIILVMLQPVAVGAWCTLCLVTAASMLVMIPLALDEVVAMLQFVRQRKRQGESVWRVFWLGGGLDEEAGGDADARPVTWKPRGMVYGFTPTWALAGATTLGLWLLVAPDVLSIGGALGDSDRIIGTLIIVTSVIAMAEVARPGRFVNLALSAWLLLATWLLDGGGTAAHVNDMVVALALAALSLPAGRARDHYGAYDRIAHWRLSRSGQRSPARRSAAAR